MDFPLQAFGATPGTYTEAVTIPTSADTTCLYLIPPEFGCYPLTGVNQLILNWTLYTMPTAATYVQIGPVSFRNLLVTVDGGTPNVGYVVSGTGVLNLEFNAFTFDQLDSINGIVKPHPYYIRKTAVDSATFGTSTLVSAIGSRHAIPIADRYVGFFVNHDGTTGTGSHTVSVEISWA